MSLAILLVAALPAQPPGMGGMVFPRQSSYSQNAPYGSYLYQSSFCMDHQLRQPVRWYCPQAGDIYLSTEDAWLMARIGHKFVGSGAPHHSGIIFQRSNGEMALLEGGPQNSLFIRTVDLLPQLTMYSSYERVWIRQRKVPLTPEQSRRLTIYAEAVANRPFAAVRMVLEAGPFRTRGPIRTPLRGRPYAANFDPANPKANLRRSYFCSEVVTESLVAARVFDPETSRPTSTFPRQLFYGTSDNWYLRRHLKMDDWYPPARFTSLPGKEPKLKALPWLDGDTCNVSTHRFRR